MRIRSTHIVVTVAAGLAVGVLLYRFATLGVLTVDGLRVVLPCIAAVLVGAGAVLYAIHTKGDRLHVATRSVIAVASIGVATSVLCFAAPASDKRIPLVRRQLPGFSVELPTATPTKEHVEYGAGSIEFDLDTGYFAIAWSRAQPDAMVEKTLRAFAQEKGVPGDPIPLSLPGPARMSVRTFGLASNTEKALRASQLPCGKRSLLLLSAGRSIESTHRRILKSIACTPDLIEENAATPVRVSLELPGWTAWIKARGFRALTDGRSLLLVTEGPPRKWTLEELALGAPLLIANGVVTTKAAVGDRIPFEGKFWGEPRVGWVRAVSCSTNGIVLVGITYTNEEAEALYIATKNARCLRAGETPSDWPMSPTE